MGNSTQKSETDGGTPSHERLGSVMRAEEKLQTCALEFGRMWGCDQREHPRDYWLKLNHKLWRELALAALEYAEVIDSPNTGRQVRREEKQEKS